MDKIRAITADDEPLARRGIRQLLEAHADITVVAETRNGHETVRALRELRPELVFLDVQMPELDGFGVLQEIGSKHMPEVIFVTAYDQFAVRAFDAHALDYLVKPLEEARFSEALQRMRERLRSAKAFELSRKLSALLASHEKERAKQRIRVTTSAGELLIDSCRGCRKAPECDPVKNGGLGHVFLETDRDVHSLSWNGCGSVA